MSESIPHCLALITILGNEGIAPTFSKEQVSKNYLLYNKSSINYRGHITEE